MASLGHVIQVGERLVIEDLQSQVGLAEQGFFLNPWEGAKFLLFHGGLLDTFETRQPIRGPEDMQRVAVIYRELQKELRATKAACVLNICAIPQGGLGYLLGFQALYSIIQENGVSAQTTGKSSVISTISGL